MSRVTSPDQRSRWKQKRYLIPIILLVPLSGFVFVNNTSMFVSTPVGTPGVLAHRGVSQTFPMDGIEADTCTAGRITPPAHHYLENTVAGIRAAFDEGADQVEFDVHWTSDNQFAVFHDWKLDCRTNGTGTTREHTMDHLRRLDIGYGYTADNGRTHPFRGKGIGLMPNLDEVLAAFPTQSLLIDIKSNDPAEGRALAARLTRLSPDRMSGITVYGGDEPIAAIREHLPQLRVMSKKIMVDCLGTYVALGWAGFVPAACRHTQLHIPEGYARWLWGWPGRFSERFAAVDARIVLVAGSGTVSEGFDTPESLRRIPAGFTGLVWTNRVDIISPAMLAQPGP